MLLGSDNSQLQRAAVEALTDLVMCPRSIKRLQGENGDQDIRLFLLFSQDDDVRLQSAATGALAMVSNDPIIATKIAKYWMIDVKKTNQNAQPDTSLQSESESGVAEQQNIADALQLNVLQVLMYGPTTDDNVRKRVSVILENMAAHGLYKFIQLPHIIPNIKD